MLCPNVTPFAHRNRNRNRSPRTSSPNRMENVHGPIFHIATAPTLELGNISAIGTAQNHDDSIDSVFMQSPPHYDLCNDQKQSMASEPKKSIEVKPIRLILHSEGGAAVCRICHSSEKSCPFSNGEPLISACYCRGSTGLYHRTCLERWLSTSGKEMCEICQFQYQIERRPKDLIEFLRKPGSNSIRRHLISDFICWLVLTPTAIVGTWLCVSGAVSRASTSGKGEDMDRVQVTTLVGLAGFLVMTYLVWSLLCVRYHIRTYRRWQTRNYWVRVVLANDKKRRVQSKPSPDTDSNKGDAGQDPMATPVRDTDATPRLVPRSVTSAGTYYSTPWAAEHRRLPHGPVIPRVYLTPEHGPVASSVPGTPSTPMEDAL